MNTTKFAPVAMFPLPMHHGITVFLMTLTGMVALGLLCKMFSGSRAHNSVF